MIATGIHHLALSTKNMKAQIAFFSEVCGMDLMGLFWMHGANGAFHCFLKLNDSSYLSFVQTPDMQNKEPVAGVSHPPHLVAGAAPGGLQHVSFNIGTQKELIAMRDRVRKAGYQAIGPVDHGISQSIYLNAPENIMIEFSCAEGGKALTADMWVDPKCAELCGISPDELQRYVHPAALKLTDGSEPMPTHPKLTLTILPPPVMAEFLKMSDAELSAKMNYTVAPNEKSAA
jgi:catechol 2,3-dioxygenase-like lactoylglutathione lyase family enzyme